MKKGLLKILKIIIFIVIIFNVLDCLVVCAESVETDFIEEALEASGGNKLEESYSKEVKEFFEKNNITIGDTEGILSLEPKQIFNYLLNKVKEYGLAPIRLFMSLIVVVILASLIDSIGDTTKGTSTAKVFNIITIVICILILSESVYDCIEEAANAINEGSIFMLGFVPVFSAIVAGGGGITSAGVYNVIVLLAAEIGVQFASTFLMPLLSLCMALAIVDAINPAISLASLIEGIKKGVSWCLGFMMTIFVGMLSLQSVIGNAADSFSVKAAKFMVSSLIPVVGSAVSDAFTTVKGSIGLLKTGVGGVGIIVILITVMPVIITTGLNRVAIAGAGICADIFNSKELTKLFKNISAVISIAFSILISFTIMFIISTAIIMALVQ